MLSYEILDWLVLIYFLLLNGAYIIMNVLAFFNINKYNQKSQINELKKIYRTRFYKPISVLVPAYNEEKTIISNVRSLLTLDYPEYEVVIINDGSKDNTLALLQQAFQLVTAPQSIRKSLPSQPIKDIYISKTEPRMIVVDKYNGGKADALNAGINTASFPLFCTVDSDSLLEKDCLLKVVRPFTEDLSTVAVGGIVRIANGCKIENDQIIEALVPKNWWARFQVVEYFRAFLFGRMGWDALDSLLIVSGAFGLFRKKAVIDAGGYLEGTVGEDMELVVRLHRFMREKKKKYRITFVPDPVCWTEVPEDLSILARQRARWQKGMAETLWKHKAMLFNPRYGWIGMFAFPYFLLFELFGSVIEVAGFFFLLWTWWAGLVNWHFALLFFMVAVILGIVLSLSSIVLEELFFHRYLGWRQVMTLAWFAVLENFFYRQMHSLWRLKGLIQFMTGNHSWGEMNRKGFNHGHPV